MLAGMRSALSLLIVLMAAYAVLLCLVYLGQGRMLYLPRIAGMPDGGDPGDLGLDFESVTLPTADGLRLHGWFVPSGTTRGTTVLFFHGNAGNITHRLDSIAQLNRLGLDLLLVDYRGYGRSEGVPSEAGTREDARAAWRYLLQEQRLAPGRIVLFGRSLGAAVAAQLATEVRPGALIIESAFLSVPELAAHHYWYLPARLLSRYRYDTRAALADRQCPLLVIHSPDDEIAPYAHGEALYRAAPPPKQMLVIRGGHNDGFLLSQDQYLTALDAFLRAQEL